MRNILPQHIDINKLDGLGIFELRNLARSLGVPRPTTMKREDLITSIRNQIQSGSVAVAKSSRGRPPRDFTFDLSKIIDNEPSYLATMLTESDMPFSVQAPQSSADQTKIVEGFVHLLQGYDAVLIGNDLNGYRIMGKTLASYSLVMGDKVKGKAVYNDTRRIYTVDEIISINGVPPNAMRDDAIHFDNLKGERPSRAFTIDKNTIKLGQRVLVKTTKNLDRIEDLARLARINCKKTNERPVIIGLLIEETDDSADYLLKNGADEVFLSKVNLSIKKQFLICLYSLFRAKELVEQGKDVILVIDSINKLFKIYNNSIFPEFHLKVNQVNLPSVADLKSFFQSARQIEGGASLTIISYVNHPINEMEEYVFGEFTDLSNIIIDDMLCEI